jgi:hypothetical protein
MDQSAQSPAATTAPAANAMQWNDKCLATLGKGIFDRYGFRSYYPSGDHACRFKIAERFREHPLRNGSQASSQLPMPMRPLF